MTDIAYSELTDRYWIMVNGSKDRDITEWMKKHDAKVLKNAFDRTYDKAWDSGHSEGIIDAMIALKSKLPDCDKIDMEHLISLIEEVAKYD